MAGTIWPSAADGAVAVVADCVSAVAEKQAPDLVTVPPRYSGSARCGEPPRQFNDPWLGGVAPDCSVAVAFDQERDGAINGLGCEIPGRLGERLRVRADSRLNRGQRANSTADQPRGVMQMLSI